ncbi:hypothetical protein M231_08059 [Tremella mesenterica]|uniref:Uncharacterized protein n=1 Tax=Tremella mesenterica TaxID=5217 RepID=A0A4Q1BAK2_TREME|nr:hypothetical protein M231_08059 [Tremella mesenterica]
MFDGSVSVAGPITEFVEVSLGDGKLGEVRPIKLDVTTLCDADVVIGWEWMREEGVILNGGVNSISFPIPQSNDGESAMSFPQPQPNEGEDLPSPLPQTRDVASLAAIGLRTRTDETDLRGKDELEELSREEQDKLVQVVPEQYHQYIDVLNPKKGGETPPPLPGPPI